jgi:hypothetical protein
LTSLDLSHPQAFGDDMQMDVPGPLRLAWDENDLSARNAAIAKVDFASEESAHALLDKWADEGRIWFAEPDYQNTLNAI